jgi:hypothetical protein
MKNVDGGVGLAPFHDWEGKIPTGLKARIQQASDGIKDGSIQIDLPQRSKVVTSYLKGEKDLERK